MNKFKRQWQEVWFYLKRPDMRLFWIFLALVVGVGVAAYAQTGISFLFWNTIGVLLVLIIVVFLNNYRLAKVNFNMEFQKNQFQGMVAHLYDGIIAYDQNFKVTAFNKRAENILGLKQDQIKGVYLTPALVQEDKWQKLVQIMFPSLAPVAVMRSDPGEFPQIVDISFTDPNMELRVTTTKVLDREGKLMGFMKIIKDRTKEVESMKAKSEFVTVAAHQLRTPLSAVAWTFDSLLNEEEISDSSKAMINNGKIATNKLIKTVNDLLDVSKIEESQFGYEMQEINIIIFVSNLLAQKMVEVKQYGISLYFDKPKEESIIVKADVKKLGAAFDNLIDNAIKYNVKNGEVTVQIRRRPREPFVQISISDTGVGIPAEEMKNLFNKFFRGSNVVKYQTEGTGLGLYITKNIIRQHGGQIWAESVLNRGTTFYLTLPTDPNLVPIKEVFIEEND